MRDQLIGDSFYQTIVEQPFETGPVDVFEAAFTKINGFRRRDYQIDASRLIWGIIFDTMVKAILI